MAWRIDYEGEVYREVDLTLDQVERIEDLTKSTWLQIAPLKSARHAKAILAVVHADRAGITTAEAFAKVGAMKADDFVAALHAEDLEAQLNLPSSYVDGIPKAGDGPATP